jgi:chromosome partitioning protein
MKVIVFAASKGGTGKTTLAYNTAIELAKDHQVLLADLDPQLSLKEMWTRRPSQQNPRLLTSVKDLPGTIAALKAAGYQHEYLIIDTPGSASPIVRVALKAADCIVLPVPPSQMDWVAQEDIAGLIDEMKLSRRMVIAVNRIEAKDELNQRTKDFFATRTQNPIPMIRRRPEYKSGFENGMAGVELSAEAGKEIRGLLSAIKRVIEGEQPASADRPTITIGGRKMPVETITIGRPSRVQRTR